MLCVNYKSYQRSHVLLLHIAYIYIGAISKRLQNVDGKYVLLVTKRLNLHSGPMWKAEDTQQDMVDGSDYTLGSNIQVCVIKESILFRSLRTSPYLGLLLLTSC